MNAAQFAVEKHGDQMYGNQPYFHHLSQVVRVLEWAGVTSQRTLDAGWLHDVIEDTDVEYHTVCDLFGDACGRIVKACTSPPLNRKERKEYVLEQLQKAGHDSMVDFEAKLVKMADRIANMENSKDMSTGHYKMYCAEIDDFLAACDNGASSTKENNTAYLLLEKRLATA